LTLQIHKQALAEQDLLDIWLYSYQQWGEAQADHYLDELNTAMQGLIDYPLAYRERLEFSPPVRICHHARHLIVYVVAERYLHIVRVLHESMDIEVLLSD
tara:strand:+ start:2150 stop:2449 length:300 start_codon:yes stop_codon:yes gene_type:complete